jgi:hypothetical protein
MGNKYTTVEMVLAEIPGDVPESLTEEKVEQYIEDASRYVDARLPNYAVFPDIGAAPPTPPVIEKIARLIAAHDCMVFLGQMRGDAGAGSEMRDIAERILERLFAADGKDAIAMLDPSEYDYSITPPREQARLLDKSRPHSFYEADIKRRDYPSDDVEDL